VPVAFTPKGSGSMGLRFVLQARPPFISLNMHFLFVRSKLCRQLPSDSQSPTTPLPLANDSYYQVHSGLPPPSYRPCRAHNKNPRCFHPGGFFNSPIIIVGLNGDYFQFLAFRLFIKLFCQLGLVMAERRIH
jgi:hypothetical protein